MSLCSQTQTCNSIFYLLDPDLFLKPTSPQFLLETVWINRYVRSTPPGTRLFRAKNSSMGIRQGFPDCFKDKARVCNQPVTALSSSIKQTQKKDCLREALSLLPRDSVSTAPFTSCDHGAQHQWQKHGFRIRQRAWRNTSFSKAMSLLFRILQKWTFFFFFYLGNIYVIYQV